MPNVAVIDISQKILDTNTAPEVTISTDNVCTITFKIVAGSKADRRQTSGKEKGESRDASYDTNLVQNNTNLNKVRVKLVPEARNDGRATLIVEADLETKIPGTGSFFHAEDGDGELNTNYATSKAD